MTDDPTLAEDLTAARCPLCPWSAYQAVEAQDTARIATVLARALIAHLEATHPDRPDDPLYAEYWTADLARVRRYRASFESFVTLAATDPKLDVDYGRKRIAAIDAVLRAREAKR